MGQSLHLVSAADPIPEQRFEQHWPAAGLSARYHIARAGDEYVMTEHLQLGGEQSSQSHALAVAVGSGNHGITYLVEQPGGFLFEAPASWYRKLDGWQMSPGYESAHHQGFHRPITSECLYCHSGGARSIAGSGNGYQPGRMFVEPAISCERCHGGGADHVKRQKEGGGRPEPGEIVNPAKLSASLAMDVCLQCHRSEGGGAAVLRRGLDWYDFQPGRPLAEVAAQFEVEHADLDAVGVHFAGKATQLRASRCFQESQGEMSCLSCHSIHSKPPAEQRVAANRNQCLACHQAGCASPPENRLAQQADDDCAACHMPKTTPADIQHSEITDHRIRVVGRSVPQSQSLPKVHTLRPVDSPVDPDQAPRDLGIAYFQYAGLNPEQAPAYFHRAASLLEPIVRDDPHDVQARLAFARSLAATGAHRRALGEFQACFQDMPADARTYTQAAYSALQLHDAPLAEGLLERALKINPYQLEALTALGRLRATRGDHDSAGRLRQRAAAVDHRFGLDP